MDSPSGPQRGQTAGLARRRARGHWYRMVARQYKAQIDSDAGALRVGGRYNPAGEFGALYLAESEDACRAEVMRRIDPDVTLSLGKLEIDLEAVCDLTDPAVRQALRVSHAELVGDDWSITQKIGRELRNAGFEGLLAPSAAGPYAVLVIFKDRLRPKSSIRLVPHRLLICGMASYHGGLRKPGLAERVVMGSVGDFWVCMRLRGLRRLRSCMSDRPRPKD